MPQEPYASGQLTGLAAQVPPERVQALLVARSPDLFDDPDRFDVFTEIVRGIATEVANIVGPEPVDWVRDSALWAIALGAAAQIEESLFPEQQLGDTTRAQQLQSKYAAVLADLRRNAPSIGGRGGSVRTVRLVSGSGGPW